MPTNCPNCNSEQRFIIKQREVDAGWLEKYIRCLMCRWESIIDYTTTEIEMLHKTISQAEDRCAWEINQHGSPSVTILRIRDEKNRELSTLLTELYAKVREVNGSSSDHQTPA